MNNGIPLTEEEWRMFWNIAEHGIESNDTNEFMKKAKYQIQNNQAIVDRLENATPEQFREWFYNSMYSGCIDDGYDAKIAIKEMKNELLGTTEHSGSKA